MRPKGQWQLQPAERAGAAAILLALVGGAISPVLAVWPLLLFLLACLFAPFLPRSSFYLPVISRGAAGSPGIALTFDDGPFPASTPILLDLLARYRLPATFFVVGERAAAYPQLIAAILAGGHTIGNHSWRHDNLLMLRSEKRLQQDIETTQKVLSAQGARPLLFRPPVGITGPRLGPVLARIGLTAVTFSCRPYDGGNRRVGRLAARVLRRLQPGQILLLHDVPPKKAGDRAAWQGELDRLFSVLSREAKVVPLAQLLGKAVTVTGADQV